MFNKILNFFGILVIILVTLYLFSFISPPKIQQMLYHGTVTAKVEKTERINSGKTSKYLIFTDKEVLEDTDNWLFLKFNSSDIYGKIKEGKTYKFSVAGLRMPMLSRYRNIKRAEEVK
jgi:hypothetical protein